MKSPLWELLGRVVCPPVDALLAWWYPPPAGVEAALRAIRRAARQQGLTGPELERVTWERLRLWQALHGE